jgi:hypothetical protein
MASKQPPTPVKEGMPAALKDTSAVATQSPEGLVFKRRKKLSVEEQRVQQEAEAIEEVHERGGNRVLV